MVLQWTFTLSAFPQFPPQFTTPFTGACIVLKKLEIGGSETNFLKTSKIKNEYKQPNPIHHVIPHPTPLTSYPIHYAPILRNPTHHVRPYRFLTPFATLSNLTQPYRFLTPIATLSQPYATLPNLNPNRSPIRPLSTISTSRNNPITSAPHLTQPDAILLILN